MQLSPSECNKMIDNIGLLEKRIIETETKLRQDKSKLQDLKQNGIMYTFANSCIDSEKGMLLPDGKTPLMVKLQFSQVDNLIDDDNDDKNVDISIVGNTDSVTNTNVNIQVNEWRMCRVLKIQDARLHIELSMQTINELQTNGKVYLSDGAEIINSLSWDLVLDGWTEKPNTNLTIKNYFYNAAKSYYKQEKSSPLQSIGL